ncbi:unnamed protein product [Mytilus edulis]|uniref:EGF-like domain-containing protein n=1 Tax=Mytilus edulis TaxID=6550 RepID=A0A8S3SUX4_MYTED|nr:unnamed protein product [Mytilus edulis]
MVFPFSRTNTSASERNPCFSNPCKNSGHCAIRGSDPFCECIPQWTGQFCETPNTTPNSCDTNPCQNEGKCSLTAGGYLCTCPPTHTGNQCQFPVSPPNACSSNPCQNQGACSITTVGYVCTCPPTHTGNQCQNPVTIVSPCVPNRCMNGARCERTGGTTFRCTCTAGWIGQLCDRRNRCFSNPCANGGQCTNTATGFVCACTGQWTGPTCLLASTAVCTADYCMNGGHCNIQSDFTRSCSCITGWTGIRCQTATADNPCINNPCGSGGTCRQESRGFSCTCPIGRTGDRCQCKYTSSSTFSVSANEENIQTDLVVPVLVEELGIDVNVNVATLCNPGPCRNGAECVIFANYELCRCSGDWMGSFCERENPCKDVTCSDGEACNNFNGRAQCTGR